MALFVSLKIDPELQNEAKVKRDSLLGLILAGSRFERIAKGSIPQKYENL